MDRRSATLAAAGVLACAGLLAFVATDGPTPGPAAREVPVRREGILRKGAPLYAHPYRYGADATSRLAADARVRVVSYDGAGAVTVLLDGRTLDAEGPDVSVSLPGGCLVPLSRALSRRPSCGR